MLLKIGEDLLLDRHLLEDRLDDEVAVGEVDQLGGTRDQRPQPVRLIGGDPRLPSSLSISAATSPNPLSTRS